MKKPLYFLLVILASCSGKEENTAQIISQPALASNHSLALDTDTTNDAHPVLPERITPQEVTAAEIPVLQRLPGKLDEAWRWTDANGENLLVVFRSGQKQDVPLDPRARNDEVEMQEVSDQGDTVAITGYREYQIQLTARQYVRSVGGEYKELWRLQDKGQHCPFDLALALLPRSTAITDLDHDGLTETTLLYTKSCRSDVAPDEMKLILHEGTAKYALRGYNVVQYDSVPASQRQPAEPCCLDKLSKRQLQKAYRTTTHGGHYFSEADFKAVPVFLRFARQHWQQFSVAKPSE